MDILSTFFFLLSIARSATHKEIRDSADTFHHENTSRIIEETILLARFHTKNI